jgi:hypothetical protein
MDALYDRTGSVHAWFDAPTARIVSRSGGRLAWVSCERLHGLDGRQIGWYREGCVCGLAGAVALFTVTGNLAQLRPYRAVRGIVPVEPFEPLRPAVTATALRPARRFSWSGLMPI